MLRSLALFAAALFAFFSTSTAQVWPYVPISDTVWIKGNTETIQWRAVPEKGKGVEVLEVQLGTGGGSMVGTRSRNSLLKATWVTLI